MTSPVKPVNWEHDKQHFFKYTTYNSALIILGTGKLKWSNPALFNDPFDAQFNIQLDLNIDLLNKAISSALWESFSKGIPLPQGHILNTPLQKFKENLSSVNMNLTKEDFCETINLGLIKGIEYIKSEMEPYKNQIIDIISHIKVLCLSEINNNILMWSHYAEEHKGVVLQLKCLPECNSPWGTAKNILYSSKMPRILTEDIFLKIVEGKGFDGRSLMNSLTYTKALEWEYEKEWRICAVTEDTNLLEYIPFSPPELEAIYLGCRMPETDKRIIKDIILKHYPHTKIFHSVKSDMKFELNFQPDS
jgi:hypothetical protein